MSVRSVTSISRIATRLRKGLPPAVSWLLLLFIFYGTSVEAAHYHGRTGSRAASTTSSFVNPTPAKNLSPTQACSDCLICQLHQSFSSTLISVRADVDASTVRVPYSDSALTPILALTNSPRTDRAPPQAN